MVKTGEVVRVKVMQVDVARNRIGLSMRLDDEVEQHANKDANKAGQGNIRNQKQSKKSAYSKTKASQPVTAMAAAFANMKK